MKRQVSLGIALWLFILSSSVSLTLAEDVNMVAALTIEQKKQLLKIAQDSIELFVNKGQVLLVSMQDARLLQQEGAFVTIHKFGQLRGCIGNIIGQGPLYLLVRDMAIASATKDTDRFNPVTTDELKDLELEISVLSKPEVIKNIDEIQMGVHGVILSQGFHQGVFLPQVATETRWSKQEFLSELCSQKAGLPRSCYKDPRTIIQIFTADVFSERETKDLPDRQAGEGR